MSFLVDIAAPVLFALIFGAAGLLTLVYCLRAAIMSCAVHVWDPASPYQDLRLRDWPRVSVIIPAHNEELVIGGCLAAMGKLDYPADKLEIIVINDRSKDRTGAIIDSAAAKDPRIRPHHRPDHAHPGKPAAIKEVVDGLNSDIAVFFDADYLPSPGLLKQLVAPFVDPEVGLTMGRVVPYNTNANLLTKLIDIERRGGYAVDQRMRSAWNLLPQFGGTVGGVRMEALRSVGGWLPDVLTEDTDLTYRLFLKGWTVEYVNHAVCYEESPETWLARFKQVRRWAYGHNECLLKYLLPVIRDPHHRALRKLDAALVLLFYLFPVISFVSLIAAILYPLFYAFPPFNFTAIPALAFVMGFGNFAPYFQIITGCIKDNQVQAASLAPLLFVASTIGMIASVSALALLIKNRIVGRQFAWEKTARFRRRRHV